MNAAVTITRDSGKMIANMVTGSSLALVRFFRQIKMLLTTTLVQLTQPQLHLATKLSEMMIDEFSDPFEDRCNLATQCDASDIVRLPNRLRQNRIDKRILSLMKKFPNRGSEELMATVKTKNWPKHYDTARMGKRSQT